MATLHRIVPSSLAVPMLLSIRSNSISRTLVATLLLFSMPVLADDPWDKPADKWNLTETYKILRDSPWSPAKSKIEVSNSPIHYAEPLTKMPSSTPTGTFSGGTRGSLDLGRGKPLPEVSVLWWSSRTIRLAQQRLQQLRDPSAPRSLLQAVPLPDFVIRVEGSEALRILREAGDDLRQFVYLQTDDGMALDASEIEFHEGEKAGEDFVAFHFPRAVSGRPTVPPDVERVVFRCAATAKKGPADRPNSISLRVIFEPVKMRAAGQPDL